MAKLFKGKEINVLNNSVEEINKKINGIEQKLEILTGEKLDSVSGEIKSLEKELSTSKNLISTLANDLQELAVINKTLSLIKVNIESLKDNNSAFESRFLRLEGNYKETLEAEEKRSDERIAMEKKVDKTTEDIYQKFTEATDSYNDMLAEKTERVNRIEKDLLDANNKIGKLETQRDTFENQLIEVKIARDNYKDKLIAVEKQYNDFRTKTEPTMILNTHVKQLLGQNEQGRILLELKKLGPDSILIDDLSEKLGIASVIVKTAVNSMQEMRILHFDPQTREIRLL